MEESTIFLTLTPSDLLGLAIDAFRLPHNRSRYVKPSPLVDDGLSRGTTPSSYKEDFADDLEYFHRIQLRSDQETKVKGRIAFGSDPDRCDVLLAPKRGQYGTSGLHFYITFDDQERPVIKDVSKIGLTVSYDKQAKDQRRNHFQWILFEGFKTIRVKLRKNGLAFDVHLPKHDSNAREKEYEKKVKSFMNGASQDYLGAFNDLALRSENTSLAPSEILSPTKRPIYLEFTELGKGGFGRVYKAVNASTGFEYAGKEFFHPEQCAKEIKIIRGLRHEHIVEFVDFRRVPKPLLVMEYLALGNLETQHQLCPIADEDMELIFNQCLKGLCYLHSHGISHRDLKPENILMFSRRPPSVKLADFGLAQDIPELKTFCGSPKYAAPEIFQDQYYTDTVDIWSLAVIVLKFVYGLPEYNSTAHTNRKQELQPLGLSWCRRLITTANDWDSDRLIDFITQYMLRWEPQERLSAAECLRTAPETGLFTGALFQTGSATPRLQPIQVVNNINTEDASTILGPLWQNVAAVPSNETHASRSRGRSALIPKEQVDTFRAIIASSKNEISSALSPTVVRMRCEQTERLHPRTGSEDDQKPSPASGEPCNNKSSKRRRTINGSDLPRAPGQPPYEPLRKAELPQPQVGTPHIHHTADFYIVDCGIGDVAITKKDFKVNITQVINVAGKRDDKGMKIDVKDIKRQRKDTHFEIVKGGRMTMGSYTNFSEAIEICELYELPLTITQSLLKVQSIYQQHHEHPTEYHSNPVKYHTRRRRTSSEDRNILEEAYQINRHPTEAELERIVVHTTMEIGPVKTWFKNRRSKDRKANPLFSELNTNRPEYIQGGRDQPPAHTRSNSQNISRARQMTQGVNCRMDSPSQDDAKRSTSSQAQDTCEIPALPSLPANSFDDLSVAETDNGPLSRTNRRGSDVDLESEPLLYTNSMAQQSHLSQLRPSFEPEKLSSHYSQYLDEETMV